MKPMTRIQALVCSSLFAVGTPVASWAAGPSSDAGEVAALVVEDEEPVELSMTKLMGAKYTPGGPIPEEIAEYDGKKVKITGLMAIGTLEGQETFELTSDACGCGQSKVNHFVEVTLVDETTQYTPGEIVVTGTFEASEEIVDGFVVSLWRITADSVEEN